MALNDTSNESTLQLVDAMVTAINASTDWGTVFVAERQFETRELLKAERALVQLCPQEPDVTPNTQTLTVEITVLAKVADASVDECDPIWNMYFAIRDFLSDTVFTVKNVGVTWNPPGAPQWDRSRLASEQVMALVGTVSYSQYLYLSNVTP